MKRGIKRSHKSKIFNFLNIILIALLFVELTFVVDSEITGNPIKSVIKKAVAVESSFGKINIVKTASCIPSKEICDKKDNDCDKLVDEGGVCKTTSTAITATATKGVSKTTSQDYADLLEKGKFIVKFKEGTIIKQKTKTTGVSSVDKLNEKNKILGVEKYI